MKNTKEVSKKILNEKLTEDYLKKYYKTSYFFANLKDLNVEQINIILSKNNHFSNIIHNGWHSLNYAALTNDNKIFSLFLSYAINNGLKEIKNTEKEKNDIPKNTTLLNFCIIKDLEIPYIKTLSVIESMNETDGENHIKLTLIYNAKKVNKVVQSFFEQKEYREIANNFLLNTNDSFFSKFVEKSLGNNLLNFEKFGIDIRETINNNKNYFIKYVKSLDLSYDIFNEQYDNLGNIISKDKEINIIKNNMYFFLENGYSLDKKTDNTESVRELFENFIDNFKNYNSNVYNKFKKEITNFNKISMENELNVKQKKIVKRNKI